MPVLREVSYRWNRGELVVSSLQTGTQTRMKESCIHAVVCEFESDPDDQCPCKHKARVFVRRTSDETDY